MSQYDRYSPSLVYPYSIYDSSVAVNEKHGESASMVRRKGCFFVALGMIPVMNALFQ